MSTESLSIVRTGERYGPYYVYTDGILSWYRCEGGPPQYPQWYVWRNDSPDADGEYVDRNPATHSFPKI